MLPSFDKQIDFLIYAKLLHNLMSTITFIWYISVMHLLIIHTISFPIEPSTIVVTVLAFSQKMLIKDRAFSVH